MAEREILGWITVNGNHVPVYKGESPSMAAKRFAKEKQTTDKIASVNEKEKERSIKANKQEATKLNTTSEQQRLPKRAPLHDIKKEDANKKSDILDLYTKQRYRFASDVTGVYAFAGKGSSKEFRDADKYVRRYGGKASDWQHCAGFASITNGRTSFNVEVHWVQLENGDIREAFIKRRVDND